MLFIWWEINTTPLSFADNCHELCTHPPCFTLIADMVKWHWCTTRNTGCTLTVDCALLWLALLCLHCEVNYRWRNAIIDVWLYPGFFSLLFREPPFACKRHTRSTSRIRTGHSTHP